MGTVAEAVHWPHPRGRHTASVAVSECSLPLSFAAEELEWKGTCTGKRGEAAQTSRGPGGQMALPEA